MNSHWQQDFAQGKPLLLNAVIFGDKWRDFFSAMWR
jgi:hypothetical protein